MIHVDVEKVKNVFGSKDSVLFEKIKTAGLYEHYSSQDEDFPDPNYHYNFDDALEDIIFKYIKPGNRKTNTSFLGLVKSTPNTGLDERIAHG